MTRNGPKKRRRRQPVQRRRRIAPRSRGLWWLLGGALITCICSLFALFLWSLRPGLLVGEPGELIHVELEAENPGKVMDRLEERGLLASPLLAKAYARILLPGVDFVPRAHLLQAGISARELMQRLAEVGSRERVKVTLPEGWNHRQIARALEQRAVASELGFQAAVHDLKLLRQLGIEATSAEGYLFPATYSFAVDSDPSDIVRRLVRETHARLERLRAEARPSPDLAKLGFADHEVIILASIVEKETGRAEEAPRVARVFLNRLLHPEAGTSGRLQSDPTAGYGCMIDPLGAPSCLDYQGAIVQEMLKDRANSYNTYRITGLPPGPISNPGERALRAVLQPAEGAEFFFVADGKGGHSFSESYDDHQKAVKKLRSMPSANRSSRGGGSGP